jgi:hypothetical protein
MSKIRIDFDIKSDIYYLNVIDYSNWGLIEQKPAIIEVTLPGYSTPKVNYFNKHKNNVLTSTMLGLKCDNCPGDEQRTIDDGIYIITVKGSPETYNKTLKYLKTDLFRMRLNKLYIDSGCNCVKSDPNMFQRIVEIEFMLKGAEAHLAFDMEKEAGMLFTQAQTLLDDLLACCEEQSNRTGRGAGYSFYNRS